MARHDGIQAPSRTRDLRRHARGLNKTRLPEYADDEWAQPAADFRRFVAAGMARGVTPAWWTAQSTDACAAFSPCILGYALGRGAVEPIDMLEIDPTGSALRQMRELGDLFEGPPPWGTEDRGARDTLRHRPALRGRHLPVRSMPRRDMSTKRHRSRWLRVLRIEQQQDIWVARLTPSLAARCATTRAATRCATTLSRQDAASMWPQASHGLVSLHRRDGLASPSLRRRCSFLSCAGSQKGTRRSLWMWRCGGQPGARYLQRGDHLNESKCPQMRLQEEASRSSRAESLAKAFGLHNLDSEETQAVMKAKMSS